ncbi:hydantoinase/oxoprolinase family protein [Ruania alkalisoli]|uniref:Hydantoinase/oxoprolinase family protein n=1 Tax=Ruania alkalisoli TaxID=2779775 RepID=A0A7M1ST10_9MICO|nr:hydantoinase/oxoprolinase family protein [Ruania alkalisoli]QOR70591.1 hydantoinase/oxoprolinase family protein [Ruania alkalisoli]
MALRVGVDTGGTFTDVCLYDDETHEMTVVKVSSTPADPGTAVVAGVQEALHGGSSGNGADLASIGQFAHGTTVATNALLEGRGARTGLITTAGFRDLLELGRQRRPMLYDLTARKPTPLAARDLRLEVSERVRHDGSVEDALDDEEVRQRARELRLAGVEAVSVCFLYSYLHPQHEQRVKAILAEELPGVFVSTSHEVLPEFREYERLSTVVINSFIGPVMSGYLGRLRMSLSDHGLDAMPQVTQSNGGMMSFPTAEALPVRTVLSGPSTGVVGAARIAATSGCPDIITFDMGGTSSDVSLVREGRPTSSTGMTLDGRPVRAPMLDINTVGAGGGSIAWIDEGGHLKVGPRSAGADPGPACYGRGNDEPTVTDANVVLGILNQETLLGGAMPIDASRSFSAVERLGSQLGLSAVETAQGIISVVTANMVRAIRVISVQRGYDPADYALVAFGGAGPLHSGRLAAELGVRRTLIPQRPGALSALGMLMTELRADFSRTHIAVLDHRNVTWISEAFRSLDQDARDWFDRERVPAPAQNTRWVADLRYVGQNYELTVPVPATDADDAWRRTVAASFHDAHHTRYGYASPDQPVEIVTVRIEATGDVPRAQFPCQERTDVPICAAQAGTREVFLPEYDERRPVPLYDRRLLQHGHVVHGPAVIEQYDTTFLVLPGQDVHVDPWLVLVAEPGADHEEADQ